MVHVPSRGSGPLRFGPDVPMIPDIGPGIVDAAVYTDPERYERERTTVLRRSWQVICRSEQLARPGDFVTWDGHGETVIVTRRRDGGVSGFHNVCQHRGARIVKEPRRLRAAVYLSMAQLGLRPRGLGGRRAGPRGLRRRCAGRTVGARDRMRRVGRLGVGGPGRAGCSPAAAGVAGRRHHDRSRSVPNGGHAAGREARLGRAGQLEGHRRRVQRELPRGAPAREEHQTTGCA